jgi:hypothetical protein
VVVVVKLAADYNPLHNLDPDKPMIVSAFGRKGSGKSYFNRTIWHTWPYDRLCIDVNGNAEPGDDARPLRADDLEDGRWPSRTGMPGERERRDSLHYRADPGSARYREQLDQAVGVALMPQDHRCLVWAGEVGELMQHGRPGANMSRLLQQNRHYKVSALFDGPRPTYIDPLVMHQSDLVAVYELPNPNDRKRIADAIGYPPARFDEVCHETWREGDHWYVLWDARVRRLFSMAPIPADDEQAAA